MMGWFSWFFRKKEVLETEAYPERNWEEERLEWERHEQAVRGSTEQSETVEQEPDPEPYVSNRQKRQEKDDLIAGVVGAAVGAYAVNKALNRNNHVHRETVEERGEKALRESRDRIERLRKEADDRAKIQERLRTQQTAREAENRRNQQRNHENQQKALHAHKHHRHTSHHR